MYIFVHIYMYIYIHMYIYTYIYTYIESGASGIGVRTVSSAIGDERTIERKK